HPTTRTPLPPTTADPTDRRPPPHDHGLNKAPRTCATAHRPSTRHVPGPPPAARAVRRMLIAPPRAPASARHAPRPPGRSHQATPYRVEGGLGAVLHPELHEHVGDVGLHGLLRHGELAGDLPVRPAGRDQPQHLALPGGERDLRLAGRR